MTLLLDANLSPRVTTGLRAGGYDAAHVGDEGLLTADDHTILVHAAASGQVIVSADTDFGELFSTGDQHRPSVVLLRSADHLTPDQQAGLLVPNLPAVTDELEAGTMVTLARGRLRVRPLPLRRSS